MLIAPFSPSIGRHANTRMRKLVQNGMIASSSKIVWLRGLSTIIEMK